ncbi:MAG: hypothetical protein WC055_04430 [Melioribacteraceae bacterium]
MEMEIFSTGTHTSKNGVTKVYTEADLDSIAQSYNPEFHEAPITIGHPSDNSPAYGWVQSLKRTGDKLIATVSELLPEFKELLEQKLFKKRSVSLYPDGSLRHIGFLGALPPAVKGLKDLSFQDDEADEVVTSISGEIIARTEAETKVEAEYSNKEITSETKLGSDGKCFAGNTNNIKNIATGGGTDIAFHTTDCITNITSLLESKISEGKFTPAMKKSFVAFIESPDNTEQIIEFINSIPVIVHLDEVIQKSSQNYSEQFSGCDDYEIDSHSESIYKKLKSIQHQSGISFEAAVNQLIKTNRRAL